MIDALLAAARDTVRGLGYGAAECEIMDDGRPPPRCGSFFVALHSGKESNDAANNLDERYEFIVTVTARIVVPLDRAGDQLINRVVERVVAEREGLRARADKVRRVLHMNWGMLATANQYIREWLDGSTYGFCEPSRYKGGSVPRLVGGEWFASDPDADDMGAVIDLRFGDARRLQPQTAQVGPFV